MVRAYQRTDPENSIRRHRSKAPTENELFGLNLSIQQLANYHTLHDAIKGHPLYDNTMQIYLKILDRTRVDIPDDLQEYWIQHKDEFGLTGKFLPDDSNLRSYI